MVFNHKIQLKNFYHIFSFIREEKDTAVFIVRDIRGKNGFQEETQNGISSFRQEASFRDNKSYPDVKRLLKSFPLYLIFILFIYSPSSKREGRDNLLSPNYEKVNFQKEIKSFRTQS